VSDRPLKAVNFELLLPILDELGIDLGEPFMALPTEQHHTQLRVQALAQQTARSMATWVERGYVM